MIFLYLCIERGKIMSKGVISNCKNCGAPLEIKLKSGRYHCKCSACNSEYIQTDDGAIFINISDESKINKYKYKGEALGFEKQLYLDAQVIVMRKIEELENENQRLIHENQELRESIKSYKYPLLFIIGIAAIYVFSNLN